MTCNCDSTPEKRIPSFADNPILIDTPATTPYGPQQINIPAGCLIDTTGRVDIYNFPRLVALRVWASINDGPETEGSTDGQNWSVSGVAGARWNYAGVDHSLTVRIRFRNTTTMEETDLTQQREFIGISGDPACQYYSYFQPIGGKVPSTPIEEMMPRYFRVTPEFSGDVAYGKMAGGLLALNSVYLAYDTLTSTPECPVWRDGGLPPGVGGWMLRVFRSGMGFEARLSIQGMNDSSVFPAQVMISRKWAFDSKNLLHGLLEIGNTRTSVTLIVEPA